LQLCLLVRIRFLFAVTQLDIRRKNVLRAPHTHNSVMALWAFNGRAPYEVLLGDAVEPPSELRWTDPPQSSGRRHALEPAGIRPRWDSSLF
jgi:hypothetical protein